MTEGGWREGERESERERDGGQSLMAAVAAHHLSRWHWRKQHFPDLQPRTCMERQLKKVSGTARPHTLGLLQWEGISFYVALKVKFLPAL